jgi:hypothetical protein
MRKLFIMLCAIMAAINTRAAVGNQFSIDKLTYTVLTEDSENVAGTVSVEPLNSRINGEIVVPETVTNNGFAYSVTTVNDLAFYACSRMKSIDLPATVSHIGSMAFQKCSGLQDVFIRSVNADIADDAFAGMFNYETVFWIHAPRGFDFGNVDTTIDGFPFKGGLCYWCVIEEPVFTIGCLDYYLIGMDENGIGGTVSVGRASGISDKDFPSIVEVPESVMQDNVTYTVTAVRQFGFNQLDNLVKIILPESVDSIGDYAFSECHNLTDINLPEAMTKIQLAVFWDCPSLDNITLGPEVRRLEASAFQDCSSLANFSFNSVLETIGGYALSGCAIKSVTVPESVRHIGEYAFSSCSSMTDFFLLSTDIELDDQAFRGIGTERNPVTLHVPAGTDFGGIDTTEGVFRWYLGYFILADDSPIFVIGDLLYTVILNSNGEPTGNVSVQAANADISGDVVIPETVEYEGQTYAVSRIVYKGFYDCQNITSVDIPSNVAVIESYAFTGCNKMTAVTLREGLAELRDHAFWNGPILNSIYIPSTVTKMDYAAFAACNIKNVHISDVRKYCEIAFDTSSTGHNFNEGCTLYVNNEAVTKLVIPEGTQRIGHFAFSFCTNIKEVEIPSTVTYIGTEAFRGCSGLTAIDIPGSVKTIYKSSFEKCTSLASVTLNEGITNIGNGGGDTFLDCTSLVSVKVPSTVTSLSTATFDGCSSLQEVILLCNIKKLPQNTFHNCSSLTNVSLSNTITEFGTAVFEGCTSLVDIQLPSKLKTIGGSAFYGCFSLKNVGMPATVSSIGHYAFYSCSSLESFEWPKLATQIKRSTFANCTNLKDIRIPSTVKTIEVEAFYDCSSLESVYIPESVTNFEQFYLNNHPGVFQKTGLRMVKIPNSVKSISRSMFNDCASLTHITLPSHLDSLNAKNVGVGFIDRSDRITEMTIPAFVKETGMIQNSGHLSSIFIMADQIQEDLLNQSNADGLTFYVKPSVFDEKYPDGKWYDYNVSKKIPLAMTNASGEPIEYKTLCRDFDVDFTHTNDNLPEGVRPLRAYVVEDVDGEMRLVFLNELKYIPSRLKANATDEYGNLYQGVDEYVGILLRGTPGYTYYYEMGEHDYTQGAWGQWLMDDAMANSGSTFEDNLMAGDANDDFYVHKIVLDENDDEIVNYGLNNNRFKIYKKDGWLNYNKSYLQLPKSVSDAIEKGADADGYANLTMVFSNSDGTTDKVSATEFTRNAESDIFYNPMGQRVKADAKGIVIQKGKKVLRK